MNDWAGGYVVDVGYMYGYYMELCPLRARLAFLNKGLVCPEFGHACELGFGQGISINIHSASSGTRWYGTDFNPSQAGFAKELAAASESGAQLSDDDFLTFTKRTDLPDFDFIGLHGTWSWINDENRALIVDFVRRKLKVGGVLYVSYNTLPGWATFAPIRHLMTKHADVMGAKGRGIVNRISDAIDFADRLLATDPAFLKANPAVSERVQALKAQNRRYLAHEYFNDDWHPMHFSTMAAWLQPAKLQFACSATYIEHVDAVNLTQEQQKFLMEIPTKSFRESVRDFMVNQHFRRDYWIKGARKLAPLEQAEALRAQKIMLTTYRNDVSLKVNGALGEATMAENVYGPILDYLSDNKAKTLLQIEQAVKDRNITFAQVLEAIMVLAGGGYLSSVQEESVAAKAKASSDKLNAHLISKARTSSDIRYLASPVTGSAVAVGRFHQLFLLAYRQGMSEPSAWAAEAWRIFREQGKKVLKEGQVLSTDEENLAELKTQAEIFAAKHLPILKAMKVVD